jgi:microsomal dipeptidase-like Zn-dependent dipeptidase
VKHRNRLILIVIVIAIILATLRFTAAFVEQKRNALTGTHYRVSSTAEELQKQLTIADLHADSLLWARDLSERGEQGHLDLPRLREGNVGLQVFSIVNDVPVGINIESNPTDHIDSLSLLSFAQLWPPQTWFSPFQRAKWQINKLHQLVKANHDLMLITSRADLDAWQQRRARGEKVIGAMLALEGAQPIVGYPAWLDSLQASGLRMIGLTHFFDNAFAGSAHGEQKGGLSDEGRALIRELEQYGIIIDLAHASPRAIDDVLSIATRPLVVSHTGVRATCDNLRNLSDDQMRRIADKGGIIGIGFWDVATCGNNVESIARAIRHAVQVMGPDHVALGSDFDGSVTVPIDASRYAELTAALLDAGIDQTTIGKVMGDNVVRFLQRALP